MYYGSINSIIDKPQERTIVGAWVAVNEFYKALFDFGHYEGYHFFVSDNYLFEVKKRFEEMYSSSPNYDKLKIIRLSKLSMYINKYDYEVFHHTDITAQLYYNLREVMFEKKIPISCFVHLASNPTIMGIYRSLLYLETFSYDTIICPTKSISQCISNILNQGIEKIKTTGMYKGKLEIIPFGIDLNKFMPRDKNKAREKFAIPKDITIIGYIGRLAGNNKMDLLPLIKIFSNILNKTQRKDIYLYIIGKEQENDYIKLLYSLATSLRVDDKVRFITDHDNNEIQYYYSCLDIFVSPCDHVQETFGITPIEAMSSGIPAVVADWDGYKESIIQGYSGYKVTTYWSSSADYLDPSSENLELGKKYLRLNQAVAIDIDEYVEILHKLINDFGLRERLGINARKHVEENYDWKKIINRYELLWKNNYQEYKASPPCGLQKYKSKFYDVFKHYPTRIIENDDTIVSTKFYNTLKEHGQEVIIHKDMKDTILVKYIDLINSYSQTPIKIIDIMSSIIKNKVDEEFILRHIMWMLKHDYLKLVYIKKC